MTWHSPAEGLAPAASQSPDIWTIPLGNDGIMEVWQRPGNDPDPADGSAGPGWYSRWRDAAGMVVGEFGPYTARSEAIEQAVLAWYGGAPAGM